MAMIPEHRLPRAVMDADINFSLHKCHDAAVKVNVFTSTKKTLSEAAKEYKGVIFCGG